MVALPPRPEQEIINRVYSAIEREKSDAEVYLGRLGASSVGDECGRKVWLDWRAFAREKFNGRMLRLFETGHQQETRVVDDLRRAGFAVWDKREDGKQFEFTDATGHFITKVDGVIKGVPDSEEKPHTLEIKTHNKNSFSGLQKKGVAEAKPEHYAQMQVSMALNNTDRALYVAVCKDDEQYHVERVHADGKEQKRLLDRVIKLVDARLRPAGISDNPETFACKFCGMNAVCYGREQPLRNCRTCRMCTPAAEGKWACELNKKTLSFDEQRRACEHWDPL